MLVSGVGIKNTFATIQEVEWYNYYESTYNQNKLYVCDVPYSYGRLCTFRLDDLAGTAVGKSNLVTPYDSTQWLNTDGSSLLTINLYYIGQTRQIRMTGASASYTNKGRFLCSLQFNSGSGTAASYGAIVYNG